MARLARLALVDVFFLKKKKTFQWSFDHEMMAISTRATKCVNPSHLYTAQHVPCCACAFFFFLLTQGFAATSFNVCPKRYHRLVRHTPSSFLTQMLTQLHYAQPAPHPPLQRPQQQSTSQCVGLFWSFIRTLTRNEICFFSSVIDDTVFR